MEILLTFTGFHDPYSPSLIAGEEQTGPILSLINEKYFDKVFLFATPKTDAITSKTEAAIINRWSSTQVDIISTELDDPTDYSAIMKLLRFHLKRILENEPQARMYVAVASGTPQMHACWMLLVASGEFPAKILHVRPPKFVTSDRPLVSEIDFSTPDFPTIRTRIGYFENFDESRKGIAEIIKRIGIVGDHPKLQKAIEMTLRVAETDSNFSICGETGTGKELFARLAHAASTRSSRVFSTLNCGAIPKELADSILFGHKKGAFTSAVNDHAGKFEQADGGTLFLDEVGELSLEVQTKLLRVLQEKEIEPLGSKTTKIIDVRLITATHRNLRQMVMEKSFREDLYYRLNVVEVRLPSLRERRSDISKLALHFLDKLNATVRGEKSLTTSSLQKLVKYQWRGNIRELQNVLESAFVLSTSGTIDAENIQLHDDEVMNALDYLLPDIHDGFKLEDYFSDLRKNLILRTLEEESGNQSSTARRLGTTAQNVSQFLKKNKNDEVKQ